MRLAIVTPIVVAVVLSASAGQAAFTTDTCLAAKLTAAGNFRKCRDGQRAKLLQSKPADVAKCSTKFQDKIAKLSEKASKAGIPCRYGDNGDGTVTDYDTGLQWEQKNGAGGGVNLSNPHDVDNVYDWSSDSATTAMSGTVFTDFLTRLNNCSFAPGIVINLAGFAFHCDWRLPTLGELKTIVDETQGFCGGAGSGVCIDPIFGPTAAAFHWSSTTDTDNLSDAWGVFFGDGVVIDNTKTNATTNHARAVRGGL
jgi:hypothetical protein